MRRDNRERVSIMSESKKSVDALVASLREEVQSFEQYSAGLSIDEIQEKYGLSQVVKLASNENPLGTSPLVQKTLRHYADHAFRYPQTGNPRLCKAIAKYVGVPPECIVAGNGSDELIDLVIRCRVRPGKENVVAFDPCFSMYQLQSQLCGVEFRQIPLNDDYSFPWEKVLDTVDENTGVVFLTSPDNPSGYTAPLDKVLELAKALPPECLFVVDEAYIDFYPAARGALAPGCRRILQGWRLSAAQPRDPADFFQNVRPGRGAARIRRMRSVAGRLSLADPRAFQREPDGRTGRNGGSGRYAVLQGNAGSARWKGKSNSRKA